MFKYIDNQRGFTILELLVVIGIIGVLATIALPKFGGVREDANSAVSKSNLKSLQTAIERYRLNNGKYPTQLAELVATGLVKSKSCMIPDSTSPYQYGEDGTDFLVYDDQYNLYTTSNGVEEDYSLYTGTITPATQTL